MFVHDREVEPSQIGAGDEVVRCHTPSTVFDQVPKHTPQRCHHKIAPPPPAMSPPISLPPPEARCHGELPCATLAPT
jgi:hypothetical protein